MNLKLTILEKIDWMMGIMADTITQHIAKSKIESRYYRDEYVHHFTYNPKKKTWSKKVVNWKTSSKPETISKMHTTLVYEFYDESGEWFDISDVPVKQDHRSNTYLGDLNETNIDNIVDYLNRPDVIESHKCNYKEFNIDLVDTNCYCEVRSNATLIYLQFKVNTKFTADGTRIESK